ncbi:MAG: YcxB family protein [PVC group bacterium]
MITVTGQSGFKDYLQAERYHSRRRTLAIVSILVIMAVIISLVTRAYLVPGLVIIYAVVLRPIYLRTHLRRHWEQTPSAHRGEKTYSLNVAGFHAEDDEGNPVVTHWDTFSGFRESRHTFLLYLSPAAYFFLPKRFIEPSAQDAIRQLLEERIPRRRGCPPRRRRGTEENNRRE